MRLTIACCLWQSTANTPDSSACFGESWVVKLYNGWCRNLTVPFDFVCFTDRKRKLPKEIGQEIFRSARDQAAHYGWMIEPYRLNVPMILTGLDTVIVGNCDHYAEYCLHGEKIALLRHTKPKWRDVQSINGVQFVPMGWRHIYDEWAFNGSQENDMVWLRRYAWLPIDDHWPGEIISFRWVQENRLPPEARIVFGHGTAKPHLHPGLKWVQEHWR